MKTQGIPEQHHKPSRRTRTLYVKPEDAEVFEDAALLFGGRLSALVAHLLRQWVAANDPKGETRRALRKAMARTKDIGLGGQDK